MRISLIQTAAVLLPLLSCVLLLRRRYESRSTVRLLTANFGCLIMNSGCLLLVIAQGTAEAMTALKVEYLGSAVMYFFYAAFLAEYLHIPVPRFVRWIWAGFEGCCVAVFWQDKLRDRWFAQYSFSDHPRFHVLSASCQPHLLACLRYGLLAAILSALLIVSAAGVLKKNRIGARVQMLHLTGGMLLMTVPLLVLVTVHPLMHYAPMCGAVGLLWTAIRMQSDSYLSVTESGHEWVFRQMEDAYILTDSSFGFLDANFSARKLFPALEKLHLGDPLPEDIQAFFGPENTINHDGAFYEKKLTKLERGGTVLGYALLLDDDTDQRDYMRLLDRYNDDLKREVAAQTQQIQDVQDSIITGLASVVESRDDSTGGHIIRTSKIVRCFAKRLRLNMDELGIDETFLQNVIKAAPMHDIGKIAIRDSILRKPGRFTDEEFDEMKRHPKVGAELLKDILSEIDDAPFKQIAINVAHYHHERWDGRGYPEKLAGNDIPIEARIMALADVFDALVSKRVYKEAQGYEEAFSIIASELNTHFDPFLGAVFLQCRSELEALYDRLTGRVKESTEPESAAG